MRKLYNINLFIFSLLAFGLAGGYVHAQSNSALNTNSVQFIISPETPGPNEKVTIEAQGVGGFLGDANIVWQQNGKTVLSGAGERSFSFTTGAVGVKTRIQVNIDSASSGNFVKEFVFTPSTINLLWEANTSAPPLFRGKTLYSPGSSIKVVAMPRIVSNGSYVSANNLSFQWSVGGEPVVAQSGFGRSTFTYYGNQLNQSEAIGVDVSLAGSPVGHADLFLPGTEPELLLYVKDPLRGTLYDQAMPSTMSLVGQEVTLSAQPYYFSNESLAEKTLTYVWALDGKTVTGPETGAGVLTLRPSGSGQGQSSLSVSLQNNDTYKFLQAASVRLQILFGQPTNTGSGFGI